MGVRSGFRDQLPSLICESCRPAARIQTAAAGRWILVNEQHRGALVSRCQCGGKSGGPCTDDEDVAKVVTLRRGSACGPQVHFTQTREGAEHSLPTRKPPLAMERLVVEPDRQKWCEAVEDGEPVVSKATTRVNGVDVPIRLNLHNVSAYVGNASALAAHLHQRIDIMPGGAQQAPRAVVFEGAAEYPRTPGKQRGADGIAPITLLTPAFEGELYRRIPVDALAFHVRKAAQDSASRCCAQTG